MVNPIKLAQIMRKLLQNLTLVHKVSIHVYTTYKIQIYFDIIIVSLHFYFQPQNSNLYESTSLQAIYF